MDFQFPRAGAEKRKAEPALLDSTMHFVEESRKALHLVDHDPGALPQSAERLSERAGIGEKVVVLALVEQIEAFRLRQPRSGHVLFPTPRTPKRKKLSRGVSSVLSYQSAISTSLWHAL